MFDLLLNKKILVTKDRQDAEKSFSVLKELGADIIYFPTIKIISNIETDSIKEALLKSYNYDFLILTSGNAAEIFSQAAAKYNLDLAHCKIAVVGKSTADKCRGLGFYIHIIPEEFSAKGLIKKFSTFDLINKKILIPGSSLSQKDLQIGLTGLGADVTFLPIYDVLDFSKEEIGNEVSTIKNSKPDIFVFTSPSSFKNFLKLADVNDIEKYFDGKTICAIGTTTESSIKEFDLVVNIVPNIFSLDGIVESIKEYFKTSRSIS